MSRILILYASSHGQTRSIAEAIASRLFHHRHDVEVADFEKHPPWPTDYEVVVLGSRVEFGKHAHSFVDYIETNRDALGARPTAVFSVSNAAARSSSPDPAGYLEKLFVTTGWRPDRAIAFAGGLPYRKYNWLLRLVMKQISRRNGHPTDTSRNHVFTNWDAVERFADDLNADLGATKQPARVSEVRPGS